MPHQLETSTSTVQRSLDASGGAAAKTNDVQRQELRGMGYAEGAARLAPKTVQLQEDEAAVAAPEAPVTHGVHAGESAEERDARRKARQAKIEATRKAALEAQAAARKERDKAQEGSGGEGASEGKATSQAASGDRANETEEEKKKRWEARAAKIAATKKASEEAEAAARKERDKELGGSDGAAATQGDAVDASSDVAGTPASDEHEDGEKKEKGKEKERAKKTPHRDLVPEVQDPAAAHADPTVAREQKHLRRHERKLRRVDKHAGEGDAKGPRRAWKSRNERKAKGGPPSGSSTTIGAGSRKTAGTSPATTRRA